MTVAALQWIKQRKSSVQQKYYNSERYANKRAAPNVPNYIKYASPINYEQIITTNDQLKFGLKKSYPLLPFRALEEHCLPFAIQQRWEASVAASKSVKWRHWFQTLDQKRQKAQVKRFYESTEHIFWARIWLEYEEWSKLRHARFIAAAARASTIIAQESLKKRIDRLKFRNYTRHRYGYVSDDSEMEYFETEDLEIEPEDEPEAGPLSAPLTRDDIHSLRLRLAPSYFRLPAKAVRFATQIFSGKSYEEAMAEQKANFSSWSRESRVRRVEGHPDFVVCGNVAVHKDDVAKLTLQKKRPQTGKHRRQSKQPRPG